MKEHRELQPSNEQIVAACHRAGIRSVYVDTPGVLFYTDDDGVHDIHPHRDSCEGSALFIVAVLKAFKRDMFAFELRCNDVLDIEKGWAIDWTVITQPKQELECWDMTLTAACMAAIVAAYPEEVGE